MLRAAPALIFCLIVSPCVAHAQIPITPENAASGANQPNFVALVSGMTKQQAAEAFGKPDRVITNSASERWYYGNSGLFFVEGKVIAWSGQAELEERRTLNRLQRPRSRQLSPASEWLNTWTPSDQSGADQILDELLE